MTGGQGYRALVLVTVVGCGTTPSDEGAETSESGVSMQRPDAGPEAGSNASHMNDASAEQPDPRTGSDAMEPMEPMVDPAVCQAHAQEVLEFVEAHRACGSDLNCNVVGSCSGGFGFKAVNDSSNLQAQSLSNTTPRGCRTDAGNTYSAICDEGLCIAVQNGGICDAPPGPNGACPKGRTAYGVSCPAPNAGMIEPGCYQRCDETAAPVCDPGFVCQASTTSSCDYAPADGCKSCEPRSSSLCVPGADCQVLLSLDFDGEPSATWGDSGEAELHFWATNRSAAQVRFELPACARPEVQGLPGYDFFADCTAGCDQTAPRVFTLMPGERATLAQATLARAASACNPDGIAPGTYELSFVLPGLSGAQACGSSPVELRAAAEP